MDDKLKSLMFPTDIFIKAVAEHLKKFDECVAAASIHPSWAPSTTPPPSQPSVLYSKQPKLYDYVFTMLCTHCCHWYSIPIRHSQKELELVTADFIGGINHSGCVKCSCGNTMVTSNTAVLTNISNANYGQQRKSPSVEKAIENAFQWVADHMVTKEEDRTPPGATPVNNHGRQTCFQCNGPTRLIELFTGRTQYCDVCKK
jgi:hypothetical protein